MSSRERARDSDRSSPAARAPGPRERATAPHDPRAGLSRAVQRARLAPRSLAAPDLLQLQRTLGNQAVGRLLRPGAQPRPVQAKASILHGIGQGPPARGVQRYVAIGDEKHEAMLGLLDQFLKETVLSYFGPESIYHQDRDLVLAHLRRWNTANRSFDDWPHLIDEMDNLLGDEKKRKHPEAASAIHKVLTDAGVAYAIQGSYAARLHGAPIGAGDIDVLVEDLRSAKLAFRASGMTARKGSHAVSKWVHANGTDIDLALGPEFGVDIAQRETVGGLNVLNTYEVLLSLLLRHERRQKDHEAFVWLARHKGNALTGEQQGKIAAHTPFGSWNKLMEAVDREF